MCVRVHAHVVHDARYRARKVAELTARFGADAQFQLGAMGLGDRFAPATALAAAIASLTVGGESSRGKQG